MATVGARVSGVDPSTPLSAADGSQRRVVAVRLSLIVLAAMTLASALGLAVDGAYGPPASTASMLRGYDLVTLLVAVPLLGGALWQLRTGSVVAQLVWVALLGYAVYTYALYLLVTGRDDLSLAHALVVGASVSALPLAFSTLPVDELTARCPGRTARRVVSGVLAVLAVALGSMWGAAALALALSGTLPAGSALVETPAVVHAAMALDLALLVPGYATAAVLLWRRSGWGYAAAALLLLSGTLHQVAYLAALPFQVAAGVPDAVAFDPAEPVIAAAFLGATIVLLVGRRGPRPERVHRGGAASA